MIRSGLRNSVLDLADARGSGHWDSTAGGEVDLRISGIYDKVWRRILSANRFYRVARRTPISDATGRYAVSDLTGGAGDGLQRFYRVLTVVIDARGYQEEKLTDWALAESFDQGASAFVWYLEGTNLTALPIQALKQADAIWVNWIPQRPSALTDDSSAVDWPDGYDEVLIHLAAARLLMKGGEESQAALELRGAVEEDYQEMLSDIARFSTNPLFMSPTDSALEWGGR